MLIERHNFEIYADYHQFYLEDENTSFDTSNIWTEEASKRMLAIADDLIAVGTARYETVPVNIEIHDSAPSLEIEKYSRVVECSLRTDSGKLVIAGCTEYRPDTARIEVEPAVYRGRACYGNLETIKDDWEGEDFYTLQLWKDSDFREIEVIKPEKS